MYNVRMYKDSRGNKPVENLIKEFNEGKNKEIKRDRVMLKRILFQVKQLQEYGTRLSEDIVKQVDKDNGIWELRPGDYRILFFINKPNDFVFLHWYIKKSNKIPPKELKLAIRRKKDWLKTHE